ncbi:hypothetical protein TTHERM_000013629 (macronuclear) [Tetrahymena thermophila SB210]|uniref:Uncharacterized protein n=1 Tax=Tetrahymena thermophila (strain SB210) TaxID=312017 RepID=W7XGZ4_TETTS|nr:hypothetical protein TTHERM_000013629 [Tetrahymena thermophila SB210]EWS76353.1 hypothetical protein TTHERM_000013629 [Tetrahymena thermophila SB210]|eukprot:XP_012651137.1 hypothetical protein TTHERM_000013629 [Tetrahymena thermophila SB210]
MIIQMQNQKKKNKNLTICKRRCRINLNKKMSYQMLPIKLYQKQKKKTKIQTVRKIKFSNQQNQNHQNINNLNKNVMIHKVKMINFNSHQMICLDNPKNLNNKSFNSKKELNQSQKKTKDSRINFKWYLEDHKVSKNFRLFLITSKQTYLISLWINQKSKIFSNFNMKKACKKKQQAYCHTQKVHPKSQARFQKRISLNKKTMKMTSSSIITKLTKNKVPYFLTLKKWDNQLLAIKEVKTINHYISMKKKYKIAQ